MENHSSSSSTPDLNPRNFVWIAEYCLRISRFLYRDATADTKAESGSWEGADGDFWEGTAHPLFIAGSIDRVLATPSALDPNYSDWCSHGVMAESSARGRKGLKKAA